MRLNKAHFRAITQPGFDEAEAAGIVVQSESYGSGEPQEMMRRFFAERQARKQGG